MHLMGEEQLLQFLGQDSASTHKFWTKYDSERQTVQMSEETHAEQFTGQGSQDNVVEL